MDPITLLVSPFGQVLLSVFLGETCSEARERIKAKLQGASRRLSDEDLLEQVRLAAREGRTDASGPAAANDFAAVEIAAKSLAESSNLARWFSGLPAYAQESVGAATVGQALYLAREQAKALTGVRSADLAGLTVPVPAALPPDDLTGSRLSGYELEARIGVGGFGTVYRGRNAVGKAVAVKVPHHPSQVEGVLREAQTMVDLGRHANLSGLENVVVDDPVTPHLVCDFADGADLRVLLEKEGPLSELVAEAIVLDVLAALEHAHERGVIHLDLKPENIVLTRTDPKKAVVLDFGIGVLTARAQIGASLSSQLTGARTVGTTDYLAPEVYEDAPVDGRADLYSLAVTLFELMRGRRPRGAATLDATRPALSAFFQAAYQFDRKRRPPSAAAARQELFAAIAGESEALAALQGKVRVKTSGDWCLPKDLLGREQHLPPVTAVEAINVRDQDLLQVARFPALELLDLANGGLKLQGCSRSVDWSARYPEPEVNVSLVGLGALAQLPALKGLCVSGKSIGDLEARAVSKLVSLEELSFTGCSFTDEGLGELARLPRLRTLGLANMRQLNGAGFAGFKAHPALRRVDIFWSCGVEDPLAHVAQLDVTHLRIDALTPNGAGRLSGHPKLQHLSVSRAEPGALARLERLPKLSRLRVNGGAVSDEDFAAIARQDALEHLVLTASGVTGAGLQHVRSLRNLRSLQTHCESLNAAAVEALRSLNDLTLHLTLKTSAIETFRLVLQLEALCSLVVHTRLDLSKNDMTSLAKLPRLTSLSMRVGGVTDEGLGELARAPKLRSLGLFLGESSVTGVGFAALQQAKHLADLSLYLTSCPIDAQGLKALGSLESLTDLTIRNCGMIDDALLKNLHPSMRLKEANLRDGPITLAGLAHLLKLPVLTRITLVNTEVDPEEAEAAGKAAGVSVMVFTPQREKQEKPSKRWFWPF